MLWGTEQGYLTRAGENGVVREGFMGTRRQRLGELHFHAGESNPGKRGNYSDSEKPREEVGENQGEGLGPRCGGEGPVGP